MQEPNSKTVITADLVTADDNDTRLRILYLYQLLLTQSDEDHPLSTKQITDKMEELHNIHVHRTTVKSEPMSVTLMAKELSIR